MLHPPIASHLEINIGSGHVAAFQEHEMFHAVAMHEPDCCKKTAKAPRTDGHCAFRSFFHKFNAEMSIGKKTCGQNHNEGCSLQNLWSKPQ